MRLPQNIASDAAKRVALIILRPFLLSFLEWEQVKRPGPEGAPVVVTCFRCRRYVFVLTSVTAIYLHYGSATAFSRGVLLQIPGFHRQGLAWTRRRTSSAMPDPIFTTRKASKTVNGLGQLVAERIRVAGKDPAPAVLIPAANPVCGA